MEFDAAAMRREINPEREGCVSMPLDSADLPPLPCGWAERQYSIAGRVFKLAVPDRPDALLDDPSVRVANCQDDYMPYWAYLWPAAIHMAKAVLLADWPEGSRVIELGCGLGLVGIAALAKGHRVAMTDYEPKATVVARYNARINGFSEENEEKVETFELDWRRPPQITYPIILGCDLLYEQRNLLPILDLLEVMLEPRGICWLADGGRSVAHQFWYLARERGFHVTMRDYERHELMKPGLHYQLFELQRAE